MKFQVLITLSMFCLGAHAAPGTISKTLNSLKKSPLAAEVNVTSETRRDQEDEVNGSIHFSEVNLAYKLSNKFSVRSRNTFITQFESEQDTQNTYEDTQLHLTYKLLNTREHGLTLTPQLRGVYQTNNETRLKYGSYGNIQARAYFGMPLIGKLDINKYTSYVRAQKYLIKDDNQRARDWGFRVRVTPRYKLLSNLDLNLQTTFNRYTANNDSGISSKNIEIMPNARYQYKNFAISLGIEVTPWKSNKLGSLESQDRYFSKAVYTSNLSYRLF